MPGSETVRKGRGGANKDFGPLAGGPGLQAQPGGGLTEISGHRDAVRAGCRGSSPLLVLRWGPRARQVSSPESGGGALGVGPLSDEGWGPLPIH